jgi:sugar/nucleoside kinase (ribokinase family)
MMQVSIIGNINADVVARQVSALPAPGTEEAIDSIEFRVGGAGAIAALCLAGLGIRAVLFGCVGNDPLGRVLLDELARAGVPVDGVAVGGVTGICIATEAAGRDRSFLIAPGSVREFSLSQVPDLAIWSPHVLICGYFLIPALRHGGAARLLQQVRSRGGQTLLDTGWDPDGWPSAAKEEVLELLPWVSVFAPRDLWPLALMAPNSQSSRQKSKRSTRPAPGTPSTPVLFEPGWKACPGRMLCASPHCLLRRLSPALRATVIHDGRTSQCDPARLVPR